MKSSTCTIMAALYLLLLFLGCLNCSVAEYVCYRDDMCSIEEPRPVFSLADTLDECCILPNIASGRLYDSNNCSYCGVPFAQTVGPVNITLTPPNTLILEVDVRGYSVITWLVNGSAMHAFPRLSLEQYSQRLILVNTTAKDAGLYEADVYLIGSSDPVIIQFNVFAPPTPIVSAWPSLVELNIHQPVTSVMFMCEGTESLTWTTESIPGPLRDYCNNDVDDGGEAPLDTDTTPTTDTLGEALLETVFTPEPFSGSGESLPEDVPFLSTHCSVFSSEPLNDTDIVLSILTIEGGMLQQSLNFTCTGNESSSTDMVQLLVTDEPYFIRHPRSSVSVIVTQELELVCEAIADSTPTLTWLRRTNNETTVISSSQRFNVTSKNVTERSAVTVLRVENVMVSDAGEYVCRASGSNISVAESASILGVRVPANISQGPEDSEFMFGTVAQLTCHSSGTPLPLITWSRVFDNGSRQMLDDLSPNGDYNITTYSQSGIVSSNLTFPTFQASQVGQYACTALNGVSLPNGYTQDQEATLAVKCSETEWRCFNAAQCVPLAFTCDLVSDCEDSSDEDCSQFPATILSAPEDATVTAYNSTSFSCKVFGDEAIVTWLFQGLPLTRGEVEVTNSFERILTSTLNLSRPSLDDSGQYMCSVSNGLPALSSRTVQTASASLLVLPIVPTIKIKPNTEEPRNERETLLLECHARASPTPLITWFRNGRPLPVSTMLPENNKYRTYYSEQNSNNGRAVNILEIEGIVPDIDDGVYTCRLENILDSVTNVSVTANVTVIIEPIDNCEDGLCLNGGSCQDLVEGYLCICTPQFEGLNCSRPVEDVAPPQIVQSPRDVEVEILQAVEFFCDAHASPQPSYSWFKDGVFLINTGPVGVLRLTAVQPEDRGLYTCRAENIHGNSEQSNAGLLTLSGVYQYLVNFTGCTVEGLLPTISTMTISLVGEALLHPFINSTLYSFTPRPLPDGPSPSNQVIVTVVTGTSYQQTGPTTEDLWTAVLTRLYSLTLSHSCRFPVITRYDGCPKDTYSFSTTGILWQESPISPTPIVQMCPCGSLDAPLGEEQRLRRVCGGTFRLGGEWEPVDNQCGFSIITHGLCDITTFKVEEQFGKLENATQESAQFDAFDLNIAALILQQLSQAPEVVTSKTHQENFASTYSNMLLANRIELAQSQQQFQASSSLLESLEVFVVGIEVDGDGTDLMAELLQISVVDVSESTVGTYVPQLNISDLLVGANITLPSELLVEDRRVANSVLLRDTLFVFNESILNEQMLGNLFISASLRQSVKNLSDPVIIEFYLSEMPGNTTESATCVFWDVSAKDGAGDWSTEGCQVASLEANKITCECNHLTHFGVLLSVAPVERNLPLEIITYVGIGLSLVCIVLILTTYICSRKLRRNVPGKLLINMCIPLALFYCWFLVAIHGRYYGSIEWFCFLSSSLVQYFLLVYLCWTAAESLHIYFKLVRVFSSNVKHYVLKAALLSWLVPALLTALCTGLGVHYRLWAIYDDQDSLFICYPSSWLLYFGVIVPFALIFLFNVAMFIVVMVSLGKHFYRSSQRKPSKESHMQEVRKLILIAVSLSVLFGLGWVAGLLAGVPQQIVSYIAQYVFSVLVGCQGFLIFLLHGVRSSDVRAVWKRWFYRVFCCRSIPLQKFLSTGTGSPLTLSSPTSKTAPPLFSKLNSPATSPVDVNRHSENPLYQSTDALSTSYSPTHDTAALIQQQEDGEDTEWESQTLEVNFDVEGLSASESEPDLKDLGQVPFSVGHLGTAMGYQDRIDETTQL